jgi:hypothetical protein
MSKFSRGVIEATPIVTWSKPFQRTTESSVNKAMNRHDRERWAAERVKPWGKPQRDDYDFHSWAKGAPKELLKAGCIYEYARESRKLRCLLVLMSAAKKRRDSESCSFEGLRQDDADRALSGALLYWLMEFADHLADNKSFAELVRTRGHEVERYLAAHRFNFPQLRAIQLATPVSGHSGQSWLPWPPLSWPPLEGCAVGRITFTSEGPVTSSPQRYIHHDGSETIAIRIPWGDFTDREIGSEMRNFARTHRPPNNSCKEPKRQGKRPQIMTLSYLKALSVVRIYKLEGNQWKRLKLVAKVCGYRGCVRESAAYKERCRHGRGDEPVSNSAKVEMTKARDHALKFLQNHFPGESRRSGGAKS